MKILIALCAILTASAANVIIRAEDPSDLHLLGEQACTWGPSYWCENIKTAAECKMVKSCITTKWNDMEVPEDNDEVCTVCKDMVQQARDQLESNQTQEDLKAVFEGSCKLIHVKPIVKECITIVDQFIPELVETLASQMNPSVVCSVAGLCNSARFDKLLEEHGQSKIKLNKIKSLSLNNDELEPDECSKCYTITAHMKHKLNNTPHDKLLRQMLNLCTNLSTFTDACSAIILTHFDTIYTHLQENFNAQNICHLSGQCSAKFHTHENADVGLNVEITPLSSVGMVDVGDDLPCKLCEQLVGHLRDLLIANTTVEEFQYVLDGLCKQTKSFATECTAIVDEYYPQIYEYLTKGLDSNAVCYMAGLCPVPGERSEDESIWPLVPVDAANIGIRIFQEGKERLEREKYRDLSKLKVEAMQLPIERLVPSLILQGPSDVKGKESCALCEYVLHYIQEVITNPTNEDKVKQTLEQVCEKLPKFIEGECSEFVDTYGDAIIAILAQQIDPSQVCSMLRLCPSEELLQVWESIPAKYILEEAKEKPSCPLCLLAVSQVYNVIKNNKTEANIEAELDKLCNHLPHSLKDQCTDLVQGYTKELVELLLADLTPQEVCAYIKLCEDTTNTEAHSLSSTVDEIEEILTNEIRNIREYSVESMLGKQGTCYICKGALEVVLKLVANDKTKDKVESAVNGACKRLPGAVSKPCQKFINNYGDQAIDMVVDNMPVSTVCRSLGVCSKKREYERITRVTNNEVTSTTGYSTDALISLNPMCYVCETAMNFVMKKVATDRTKDEIQNALSSACNHMPKKVSNACAKFLNKYGDKVVDIAVTDGPSTVVCTALTICTFPFSALTRDTRVTNEIRNTREYSVESILGKQGTCYVCKGALEIVLKLVVNDKTKDKVESAINVTNNEVTSTTGYSTDALISLNPICYVCETAMKYVMKKVTTDRTKDNIQNALTSACKHMPKKVSNACAKFLNKYGDKAVNIVVTDGPSTVVCTALRICTFPFSASTRDTRVINQIRNTRDYSVESMLGKQGTCYICKGALEVVLKLVVNDKTKDRVESAVNGACKHLPGVVSKPCQKFINNYGDQAIDLVVDNMPVSTVCRSLGVCSKKRESEMIEPVTNEIRVARDYSVDSMLGKQGTCYICKGALEIVLKLVVNDKTKDRVESAVNGACKHLPGVVSKPCQKFINNYGDQAIDLVVDNMPVSTVCRSLGVCSKKRESEMIEPVTNEIRVARDYSVDSMLGKQGTCFICKGALEIVLKLVVNDKTKDRVESAVNGACKHLPGVVSKPCQKFINNYGDQAIDLVVDNMPVSTICRSLGVCSKKRESEMIERVTNEIRVARDYSVDSMLGKHGTCYICKGALEIVLKLVVNDKTKDRVESAVNGACKHLPGVVSKPCQKFINNYGDQAIDLVVDNMPVSTICRSLGVCSKKRESEMIEPVTNEIRVARDYSVDSMLGKQGTCYICKGALEVVLKLVVNDKTKDRVESAVNGACKHLPGVVSKPCQKFINNYGDQAIDLVVDNMPVSTICRSLGVCSKKRESEMIEPVTNEIRVARDYSVDSMLGKQGTCYICKGALEIVLKLVVNDKTKDRVESAVNGACKHLPGVVSKPCQKFINNYGDQAIDLVVDNMPVSTICRSLGVCSKKRESEMIEPVTNEIRVARDYSVDSMLGKQGTCFICKGALEIVLKLVVNDKTKDRVESAVNGACKHLPGVVSKPCQKFINNYGDQAIDLVVDNMPVSTICRSLGVCSKKRESEMIEPVTNEIRVGRDYSVDSMLGKQGTCFICKGALEIVLKLVVNDKTKDRVESAVNGACKHLPGVVSKPCQKFINNYGDQAIDLVVDNMPVSTVCRSLGVCSKKRESEMIEPVTNEIRVARDYSVDSMLGKQGTCFICKGALEVVLKLVVNDKTKDRVESAVNGACKHLPGVVSKPCQKFINNYGDQAIDLVVDNMPVSTVCRSLGVCSKKRESEMIEPVTNEIRVARDYSVDSMLGKQGTCYICKGALEIVLKLVVNDKTKDRVESAVNGACKHLPGVVSKPCQKFINNYGDQAIDLVVDNMPVSTICRSLGVCSKKRESEMIEPVTNEIRVARDYSVDSMLGKQGTCYICKGALEIVLKLVVNDKTKDRVESAVNGACKHLPGVVSKPCQKFINNYGDQAIDLVVDNMPVSTICRSLGVCSKKRESEMIEPVTNEIRVARDYSVDSMLGKQGTCFICKGALEIVLKLVVNDKTKDRVESAVNGACKHLPGVVSKPCQKFINNYGDQAIDLVVDNMPVSTICRSLGVCSKKRESEMIEPVTNEIRVARDYSVDSMLGKQGTCYICKGALEIVLKLVVNDKTKDRVESAVNGACKHLPGVVSKPCQKFINNYGDQAIDLVVDNMPVSTICRSLGVCSKKRESEMIEPVTNEIRVARDYSVDSMLGKQGTCYICKGALEIVLKLVVNDKTKDRVESAVNGACKHLPGVVSKPCQKFINNYGDQAIDLVVDNMPVSTICRSLGVCSKKRESEMIEPVTNEIRVARDYSVDSMLGKQGTCFICKGALEIVLKLVVNDKTKDRVESAVNGACKHLPGVVSKPCQKFINNYGDQAIDLVVDNMPVSTICRSLGVCSKKRESEMIEPVTNEIRVGRDYSVDSMLGKQGTCFICKGALEIVLKLVVNDKTKDRVESAVNGACKHLPGVVSKPCQKFINNYGDQAIDLVVDNMPVSTVCRSLGVCSKKRESEMNEPVTNEIRVARDYSVDSMLGKQGTCFICKGALEVVLKLVVNDKTKDRVESAVNGACKHLPGVVSKPCQKFINNYGDQAIDLVVDNMPVSTVCRSLGVCSKKRESEMNEPVTNEIRVARDYSVDSMLGKQGTCFICKGALEVVLKLVVNDKTKDRVESAVNGACKHLPGVVSKPCQKFINNYGDQAIDLVVDNMPVSTVCRSLGVCSKKRESEMIEPVTNEIRVARDYSVDSMLGKQGTCFICKGALEIVLKLVVNDKTKDRVESAVNGACKHLPGVVSKPCQKFINNYGDQAIDLVVDNMPVSTVCRSLGVCSKKRESEMIEPVTNEIRVARDYSVDSMLGKQGTCFICKGALEIVLKLVVNDKTKDRVESAVNGACKHLPGVVSKPCQKFINNYGDQAIDLVVDNMPVSTVCRSLGVCSKKRESNAVVRASVTECAVCKGIITAIDELLADSKVDRKVKDVVSEVCDVVPARLRTQCTKVIKVYGQSIINLIERHTDTRKICSAIALCVPQDYSMVSMESLRRKRSFEKDPTKRCTWGPAYWCSTNATAVECKAVEYCKSSVWKGEFAPPIQIV